MFNIYRTIEVNDKLDTLLDQPDEYVDFESLSYWQVVFNSALAIMVFFAWVKVSYAVICGFLYVYGVCVHIIKNIYLFDLGCLLLISVNNGVKENCIMLVLYIKYVHLAMNDPFSQHMLYF